MGYSLRLKWVRSQSVLFVDFIRFSVRVTKVFYIMKRQETIAKNSIDGSNITNSLQKLITLSIISVIESLSWSLPAFVLEQEQI